MDAFVSEGDGSVMGPDGAREGCRHHYLSHLLMWDTLFISHPLFLDKGLGSLILEGDGYSHQTGESPLSFLQKFMGATTGRERPLFRRCYYMVV